MEQNQENRLQEAIELARQAAKQMKRAAKLAESAAQLWQQAQLLAQTGEFPQPPAEAQMTVTTPERRRKQPIKPETARLIENTPMRNVPRLVPVPAATEVTTPAQEENAWQDGDDWWRPRQSVAH